jgi:hypothetical protein
MPPTTSKRARKAPTDRAATGTYRFDRKTGKVVRVSDRVPKVSSKGKASSSSLPCGRSGPCGGGGCPS